jgi:hypothetical protein
MTMFYPLLKLLGRSLPLPHHDKTKLLEVRALQWKPSEVSQHHHIQQN